jgi:hypothetical protein
MGIIMTAGGPIAEYLRVTGKDKATFDRELKGGDANATTIFSAEVIYKAISDLILAVENRGETDE